MKITHWKHSPTAPPGSRKWLTIQRMWESHPESRTRLARSLKRLYRAINEVVSRPQL